MIILQIYLHLSITFITSNRYYIYTCLENRMKGVSMANNKRSRRYKRINVEQQDIQYQLALPNDYQSLYSYGRRRTRDDYDGQSSQLIKIQQNDYSQPVMKHHYIKSSLQIPNNLAKQKRKKPRNRHDHKSRKHNNQGNHYYSYSQKKQRKKQKKAPPNFTIFLIISIVFVILVLVCAGLYVMVWAQIEDQGAEAGPILNTRNDGYIQGAINILKNRIQAPTNQRNKNEIMDQNQFYENQNNQKNTQKLQKLWKIIVIQKSIKQKQESVPYQNNNLQIGTKVKQQTLKSIGDQPKRRLNSQLPNSYNSLSQNCIMVIPPVPQSPHTLVYLLSQPRISTILIYTPSDTPTPDTLLNQLKSSWAKLDNNIGVNINIYTIDNLILDADYGLFYEQAIKRACASVGLLHGQFQFEEVGAQRIGKSLQQLRNNSVSYFSKYNLMSNDVGLDNTFSKPDSKINKKKEGNTGKKTNNESQNNTKIDNQQTRPTSNHSITTTLIQLPNLDKIPLPEVDPKTISTYLLLFNPGMLRILTPLNFAYYTKYTLEQILIYPLLALVQGSDRLIRIGVEDQKGVYSVQKKYAEGAGGDQYQVMKAKVIGGGGKNLCFVSYPSNPYIPNYPDFYAYLSSVTKMSSSMISNSNQASQQNANISIIIYIPYTFKQKHQNTSLYQFTQAALQQLSLNQKISRIYLRIMQNKAVSSHAVYQSAYNYCPQKSIIVSSRHNIRFSQSFAHQLLKNMQPKYHYYATDYYTHDQQSVGLETMPIYRQKYAVRKNIKIFKPFFMSMQIFKSDLIKSIPFWVLKCAELDFYQTQAVFFIYMMEILMLRFQYIRVPLYQVLLRNQTITQLQQQKNLQKYAQYSPIPGNRLQPYQYNCLQNPSFSRTAPNKIPKSVHQIWLGNTKISPIRLRLHQTISKHNPTYNVTLWKDGDITADNFPMTYGIVVRTLQYQKSARRSYYALVSDLMRYEALYHYGGIYIDFKMEVLRSLDGFLKYNIFFIDAGIDQTRFVSPKTVGIGFMGSTPSNPYLHKILIKLTTQQIDYTNLYIPAITGGAVIRKAFTDEQLFTMVGFGYQLLIPRPSATEMNDCLKVDKFEPDQEVFQIVDTMEKRVYKVGIPCREYQEAYVINYKPLGRSWKGDKRNMG